MVKDLAEEFKFTLKLISLGAKAIEYVHKGGTILAKCRMQVIRGEGDSPGESPDSPKFEFYADRLFIKDLDAGAQFEVSFKQLRRPTRPVTDTEEKRAKAVYKDIKSIESNQVKAEKEYKAISSQLATSESEAKGAGAGGINDLSIPKQEALRALRQQAGYISSEIDRYKIIRKEAESRLPDAYQGKTEKEAEAVKAEARAKVDEKKAAEKRASRPNKPKLD